MLAELPERSMPTPDLYEHRRLGCQDQDHCLQGNRRGAAGDATRKLRVSQDK